MSQDEFIRKKRKRDYNIPNHMVIKEKNTIYRNLSINPEEINLFINSTHQKPKQNCFICKAKIDKAYSNNNINEDSSEKEVYCLICGHSIHIECVVPHIVKNFEYNESSVEKYKCKLCDTLDPNIIIYLKGSSNANLLQEVHEYEILRDFNKDCCYILEVIILIWFYYANYLLVTKIVLPEANRQAFVLLNAIINHFL